MAVESSRIILSIFAGVLFGIAWLVFIDAAANYTRCYNADWKNDPCGWGNFNISAEFQKAATAGINGTIAPVISKSVGEAGGWEPISGKIGIVVLPGLIALGSVFFVNTVESFHLKSESNLNNCQKVVIRIWLFFGFSLAFGALAAAIAIFAVQFGGKSNVKYEPGAAAIVQVILIIISSALLWIARAGAAEDSGSAV